MTISLRPIAAVLVATILACSLASCASINDKLASGMGEYIPQWAGGLPADAPPRPGPAKYDEFRRDRLSQHPRADVNP
jgi:hypothetical protein